MSAPAKLVAFVVFLAVAFGGGLAVGALAGPIDVGGTDGHNEHSSAPHVSASRQIA